MSKADHNHRSQVPKSDQYQSLSYSVPSSLLLCGEYIISEKKGVGICLGIEPRSYVHIHTSKANTTHASLSIICKYADETFIFSKADEFEFWMIAKKISAKMFQTFNMQDYFVRRIRQANCHVDIYIDTSQLYNKKKKRGLGSSACCAILVCAAYMALSNIEVTKHLALLRCFASEVHFQWQQKQGSGYEFYASVYGNALLLQNNIGARGHGDKKSKSYQSLAFPNDFSWVYWNSGKSISSRKALQKYQQWKQKEATQQEKLMKVMIDCITSYTASWNFSDCCSWLERLNVLGQTLGKAIGQNALIENIPHGVVAYKACGAGNEQAIGLLADTKERQEALHKPLQALVLSGGFRKESGTGT